MSQPKDILRNIGEGFTLTVEVVTPEGTDCDPLITRLQELAEMPFFGFSVATNPVAKAKMSALAVCSLIQQRIGKPAILHCTTRDHNRLSLQGLLWGARALGIETSLAATGDFVALGERQYTTTVRDVDIFQLIGMAREAGLTSGAVLTYHPEADRLESEIDRLKRKVETGARFAVTQPIYDEASAKALSLAVEPIGIPILMGILPLRTLRHAEFLDAKVSGIHVPRRVIERMAGTDRPIQEGAAMAKEALAVARDLFSGACLMPPFNHYEILFDILR